MSRLAVFARRMRAFLLVVCAFAALIFVGASVAFAQQGVEKSDSLTDALPWRMIISGQIEAFRRGDDVAAFGYAGMMFQRSFEAPELFVQVIRQSGYAPIIDSRSHTFGRYFLEGDAVVQVVKLQGPDQGLFEALYTLGVEPNGWRIHGVQLRRQKGVAI